MGFCAFDLCFSFDVGYGVLRMCLWVFDFCGVGIIPAICVWFSVCRLVFWVFCRYCVILCGFGFDCGFGVASLVLVDFSEILWVVCYFGLGWVACVLRGFGFAI